MASYCAGEINAIPSISNYNTPQNWWAQSCRLMPAIRSVGLTFPALPFMAVGRVLMTLAYPSPEIYLTPRWLAYLLRQCLPLIRYQTIFIW